MDKVTYKVSIDLKKNCHTRLLLGTIRGENRSRRIEVTLTEGGKPFNCADTTSATVYVLKPNQSTPSVNSASVSKNVITYDILGSDVDTVGVVQFQIKLNETVNGSTVTLISTTFEAEVDGSIVNDSGIPSQPSYTALDTALAQVSQVRAEYEEAKETLDVEVDKIEEAVEIVTELAARETTTLNTAEGYMNSAKTYSESALASKNSANTSEINAKTSETNSKTSETNAKTSETNAKASETSALSSKNSANLSEINAKASEINAKSSETNALASKTSANTSEANAKTSETNAKTSETNAKIYEANALTYKESMEQTVKEIDKRLGIAEFDVDDNGNLTYTDDSGYTFGVGDDGNLNWEVTG